MSSSQKLDQTTVSITKKNEVYPTQALSASLSPPPYRVECENERLPHYTETSLMEPYTELELIMRQFPSRWNNQRVYHHYFGQSKTLKSTSYSCSPPTEQIGQLLDRMEIYRHEDQDWSCSSQIKMSTLTKNLYHCQQSSPSAPSYQRKKAPCLSLAKLKYHKITLSIAKEREQLIYQMKKIRSSSSSPCRHSRPLVSGSRKPDTLRESEFDTFLNNIHITTAQSQMSNQRVPMVISPV